MAQPALPDRSLRLKLLGALATALGAAAIGLGALHAALPFVIGALPEGAVVLDARSAATGACVWTAAGAALASTGIGAIRRRRWSPPVMLALMWTWLLSGLLVLPLVPLVVGLTIENAATMEFAPGVSATRLLQIVFTVATALFGVVLPGLFVLALRDPDVQRTCERHDPRASWVDSCPPRVLRLSLLLALAAVLTLPMVFQPAIPLFGWIVTGLPGIVLWLGLGAFSAWLARAAYRLEPAGFWGTMALVVGGGVSLALTLWFTEPERFWREMGLAQGAGLPFDLMRNSGIAVTVAVTALSALRLWGLRREFAGSGAPRSDR